MTLERGRFYVIQNALYTSNRRDCWGYVQGGAPLEVKRVIWQHESDELINDPRAGMDHYALTVKQGEVIGLKPEDFDKAEIPSMVRACFYAWHHIAMHNHWLTAYTASHMLERRNNGKIVKGGGMSYRVGKKFENELGINLKKMISLDVHVVADTEHSENISEMFERYVKSAEGPRPGSQGRAGFDGDRPRLSRRARLLHGADSLTRRLLIRMAERFAFRNTFNRELGGHEA